MPTYEYRCDACGHQFEEFQKITDDPIARCPKCNKKKAHRLISQGNFILKGGGWYVTDYKSGGGSGRKKKDHDRDESATSSSKPDEKKSDEKKPETKDDKPAKKAVEK